jgi:hypothetical protein
MTDSIYDQLNAYGTVAKQRFVETFSGDALDTDRWDTTVSFGSFTASMADAVDEGLDLISSTSGNQGGYIDFADKRQYSHNSSVNIAVWRRAGSFGAQVGLMRTIFTDASYFEDGTYNTYKELGSADGSTNTTTASTVAVDTNFHNHSIVSGSSDIQGSIDGVLEVTKTTNRSTAAMQPFCRTTTNTTPAAQIRIRYMEAYNT